MTTKPEHLKPVDLPEMHAPIEIEITVHLMVPGKGPGRILVAMPVGQYPTRAAMQEQFEQCLAHIEPKDLPPGMRPMTKPEFVEFITRRDAGEAIALPGNQNFVPAPADIPHGMLVHAIRGVGLQREHEAEYFSRGLASRYSTDDLGRTPDAYTWDVDALDALPDDVLLAIYSRIVA